MVPRAYDSPEIGKVITSVPSHAELVSTFQKVNEYEYEHHTDNDEQDKPHIQIKHDSN
jgi:hypothetical protein